MQRLNMLRERVLPGLPDSALPTNPTSCSLIRQYDSFLKHRRCKCKDTPTS